MNNKFWNAPAWSMGDRISKNNKKSNGSNPGPGNYNLSGKVNGLGCNNRIGTSLRGTAHLQNQPGPGNYESNYKNEGPKISMGQKYNGSVIGSTNITPGPGNYNTGGEYKPGSGVTLGAKYQSVKLNVQEPGPGAYSLNNNSKSGVKIGTSKRNNFGCDSRNPGPGAYTYDKRPYSAGPKHLFGRSGRSQNHFQHYIGPGSYDIKSTIKQFDGGCTMGEKHQKGGYSATMTPGPGYYQLNGKRTAPGAKIGRAQRGESGKNVTPGPGTYGSQHVSNLYGTKIGTSKRGNMGGSGTPGPGAYQLGAQSRGGVTISGHKGKSKMDQNPGPGSYDPSDFGSRIRPGSANIGTSQRSGFKKGETPGPGQYYKYQTSECKFAYTKQARSKQLKNRDPGPGQYQIPSTVPSAPHYLIDPNIYRSGGSKI